MCAWVLCGVAFVGFGGFVFGLYGVFLGFGWSRFLGCLRMVPKGALYFDFFCVLFVGVVALHGLVVTDYLVEDGCRPLLFCVIILFVVVMVRMFILSSAPFPVWFDLGTSVLGNLGLLIDYDMGILLVKYCL